MIFLILLINLYLNIYSSPSENISDNMYINKKLGFSVTKPDSWIYQDVTKKYQRLKKWDFYKNKPEICKNLNNKDLYNNVIVSVANTDLSDTKINSAVEIEWYDLITPLSLKAILSIGSNIGKKCYHNFNIINKISEIKKDKTKFYTVEYSYDAFSKDNKKINITEKIFIAYYRGGILTISSHTPTTEQNKNNPELEKIFKSIDLENKEIPISIKGTKVKLNITPGTLVLKNRWSLINPEKGYDVSIAHYNQAYKPDKDQRIRSLSQYGYTVISVDKYDKIKNGLLFKTLVSNNGIKYILFFGNKDETYIIYYFIQNNFKKYEKELIRIINSTYYLEDEKIDKYDLVRFTVDESKSKFKYDDYFYYEKNTNLFYRTTDNKIKITLSHISNIKPYDFMKSKSFLQNPKLNGYSIKKEKVIKTKNGFDGKRVILTKNKNTALAYVLGTVKDPLFSIQIIEIFNKNTVKYIQEIDKLVESIKYKEDLVNYYY